MPDANARPGCLMFPDARTAMPFIENAGHRVAFDPCRVVTS
jgi:hypothetical protein